MNFSREIAFLVSSERYVQRTASALTRMQLIGVENVSIINKDRSLDECRAMGICMPYRAPGVDWDNQPFVSAGSPKDHLKLSRCGACHVEIWTHIASCDPNEAFLVCEDDVLFHERFIPLLDEYRVHVPEDFDMVWIGYSDSCGAEPERINDYILKGGFWCIHCYVMRPQGAKKLLSHLPMTGQIDWVTGVLASERKINGYAFDYWHDELANAGRCAYRPRGLAYQEVMDRK